MRQGSLWRDSGDPQRAHGDTSGTLTPIWPITVPVSTSHQNFFPQELPSVELSAQVWTRLAQGASPLSIPVCVTLASGYSS